MLVVILAAGVLGSAAAQTNGLGYQMSAGVSQSDNIARTADNAEEETIASAGFNLDLVRQTRKLDLATKADLAWLDYLDDTFDSELVGNFAGQARIDWIPQRLSWAVQDNFGQGTIDPVSATTPANRENINYFTTGPDLTFSLGSNLRARLTGRYSLVSYEENPFDNDRLLGAVAFIRPLATAGELSANFSHEQVDFNDDVLVRDYDRSEAFLRYEAQGRRTELGVDVGYSRLERDADSVDGLILRLEVSRELSTFSKLALAAGREYSDSGNSFRLDQTLGQTAGASGLETQLAAQTAAPFTSTYATVSWNLQRRRTGLELDLSRFDEEYEDALLSSLDRIRVLASVSASRELTNNLSARISGNYSKQNFEAPMGDFDEIGTTASLTRRIGRRLALTAQYQRFKRDSDLPLANFTENRWWLGLSYGQAAPSTDRRLPLPSNSAL